MKTLLALLFLTVACAAPRSAEPAFAGDGVHVRHVRVRLAPAETQAFEALLRSCVEAARAARLSDEHAWLCYRESPGRYWLVLFAEAADGFPFPSAPDALAGFVGSTAGPAGRATLAALEHELEWTLDLQQRGAWCTVEGISTATHPKARLMERSVRPGAAAAFDAALTARTAFLAEHDYPLPIEGFATRAGASGVEYQVLFPTDWPTFHASASIGAFVRALDEAQRAEYAARKAALMATMSKAEFYDADFLPELSYTADE